MKIKLQCTYQSAGGTSTAGEVITVKKDEGESLISAGLASEVVEPSKPEAPAKQSSKPANSTGGK